MLNNHDAQHAVIFTFPSEKFEEYGFAMRSFVQNWPKNVKGIALIEDSFKLKHFEQENLTILDFDECIGGAIEKFKQRNKWRNINDLSSYGNINVQAEKFARKVFAQIFVLENYEFDYLHYLDSDLQTLQNLSMDDIKTYAESEYLVSCFPRWWKKDHNALKSIELNKLHVGYTETGYIIWNKNHPGLKHWINLYRECYTKDYIFQFYAWHDCIAFDYATMKSMQKFENVIRDLSQGLRSEHPIVESSMGKYFDHMKGRRKFKGRSLERTKIYGKGFDKLFARLFCACSDFARTIKGKI